MGRRHWTYKGERRRRAVFRRDNWECQVRGPGCVGVATEIDHTIPRSRGGTEEMGNLRAACGPCNRRKGALLLRGLGPDGPTRTRPFFSEAGVSGEASGTISPQVRRRESRWATAARDYTRRKP
jgi:5-methylcytosine-specific restriction protein A